MPDFDRVINHLWYTDTAEILPQVYVILDASRDESIYRAIKEFRGKYCCLFSSDISEVPARRSLYLIHLTPEDSFTSWILTAGLGKNWGVFLQSIASLKQLKKHFCELLTACDEEGNELFFPFYDPRILRTYLPTCMHRELSTVFGPVTRFFIEQEYIPILFEYAFDTPGSSRTVDSNGLSIRRVGNGQTEINRNNGSSLSSCADDSAHEQLFSSRMLEDKRSTSAERGVSSRDKYTLPRQVRIDCENRRHLCRAACCALTFTLSRQDIEEGIIRWDTDTPYRIARDSKGYCRHIDKETLQCRAYEHRPIPCREYDCRDKLWIWLDFDHYIPSPILGVKLRKKAAARK